MINSFLLKAWETSQFINADQILSPMSSPLLMGLSSEATDMIDLQVAGTRSLIFWRSIIAKNGKVFSSVWKHEESYRSEIKDAYTVSFILYLGTEHKVLSVNRRKWSCINKDLHKYINETFQITFCWPRVHLLFSELCSQRGEMWIHVHFFSVTVVSKVYG